MICDIARMHGGSKANMALGGREEHHCGLGSVEYGIGAEKRQAQGLAHLAKEWIQDVNAL
jgi:hypothetical protein